jgi:hypothetical protein
MKRLIGLVVLCALVVVGCGPRTNTGVPGATGKKTIETFTPVANTKNFKEFTVSDSEYPSWATIPYACEIGLLDGRKGWLGKLELAWQVDIIEDLTTYDACVAHYGTFTTDAVCITNMDVLKPSLVRPATAILPTSTSNGADALLSTKYTTVKELAGKKIRGLPESVSDYFLGRLNEIEKLPPDSLVLENMNPDEAAVAMQTNTEENVVIWEPYTMQTLVKNPKAKVVANSSVIKGEIIDMIVVGNDSLAKEGGKAFACCLIDTYYTVNKLLDDPDTRNEALTGLGAKFSTLKAAEMEQVTTRCEFYGTPEKGLQVFGASNLNANMPKVIDFCVNRKYVASKPTYGIKQADARVNFDTQYIETVVQSWKK